MKMKLLRARDCIVAELEARRTAHVEAVAAKQVAEAADAAAAADGHALLRLFTTTYKHGVTNLTVEGAELSLLLSQHLTPILEARNLDKRHGGNFQPAIDATARRVADAELALAQLDRLLELADAGSGDEARRSWMGPSNAAEHTSAEIFIDGEDA